MAAGMDLDGTGIPTRLRMRFSRARGHITVHLAGDSIHQSLSAAMQVGDIRACPTIVDQQGDSAGVPWDFTAGAFMAVMGDNI
jgi:hypothetical protein